MLLLCSLLLGFSTVLLISFNVFLGHRQPIWPTEFVTIVNFDFTLTCYCSFTTLAHILCFCNTPSCPQAVCNSSQRCFTKLIRKASADGNVSTSVMYGCSETMNSSDTCLKSSSMICCDTELCNMPNMLRSKYSSRKI